MTLQEIYQEELLDHLYNLLMFDNTFKDVYWREQEDYDYSKEYDLNFEYIKQELLNAFYNKGDDSYIYDFIDKKP